MNVSKIIKATWSGRKFSATAPITQWDYGYLLQIEGVELPASYEIDFSNTKETGDALKVLGNENGAEIPPELIETGKDIYAFYYHIEDGFGKTVKTWQIPNQLRARRTSETPTPAQQSIIDQAISALNTAVEKTTQDVIDADESASDASQAAISAALARDSAQSAETNARTYALNAGTKAVESAQSATASAQSAQSASQSAQTASEKADAITGLTAQAQTLPEGSSASASYDAQTGVMSFGIPKGKDGTDGDDGYSPTANVSKTGKVATITITDKNGTTSAQVEDGTDGTDGVSPTVTITPITGGHRITITDKDGSHSADVMDGTGNVDDVQINGTSIVENGVANVPVASNSAYGLVKYSNGGYNGIVDAGGIISINSAFDTDTKGGTQGYKPITPRRQHQAVFYGLAKASGDTTQSQSSNAVGTYTEDAKSKISEMLNGSVSVSGTTPTIVAKAGIRYVCGEVASLDFTPSQTGICDVVFTSGATATVLTVPSTIKWANGFDPTSLDANTTYEINIMDGLGVAVGWT